MAKRRQTRETPRDGFGDRPEIRFIPLPEVPASRALGHRGPLALALEEAYEKKQAVVIPLHGKPLSAFTGSLTSTFKRDGLRVRSRTHNNEGYMWLEKVEEKK